MSLLNLEQKYLRFERELRTETFSRFSEFIWLEHDTKVTIQKCCLHSKQFPLIINEVAIFGIFHLYYLSIRLFGLLIKKTK